MSIAASVRHAFSGGKVLAQHFDRTQPNRRTRERPTVERHSASRLSEAYLRTKDLRQAIADFARAQASIGVGVETVARRGQCGAARKLGRLEHGVAIGVVVLHRIGRRGAWIDLGLANRTACRTTGGRQQRRA